MLIFGSLSLILGLLFFSQAECSGTESLDSVAKNLNGTDGDSTEGNKVSNLETKISLSDRVLADPEDVPTYQEVIDANNRGDYLCDSALYLAERSEWYYCGVAEKLTPSLSSSSPEVGKEAL